MRNKKPVLIILAIAILLMALKWREIASVFQPQLRVESKTSGSIRDQISAAKPRPNLDGSIAVKNGFENWFKRMEKVGVMPIPSPDEQLKKAVFDGEKGVVLRAFNDVVYGEYKRKGVISALKDYLSHGNEYIRYLSARSLLTVGDQSGCSILIDLVKNDKPIEGINKDVRISAAQSLSQYRESEGVTAIIDLYEKTHDGELLSYLSIFGVQAPDEQTFPFLAYPNTLEEYGKTNAIRFLPQIADTFQTHRDLKVKAAAAWALALMQNDEIAISYIQERSNSIIGNQKIVDGSASGLSEYQAGLNSLLYVGSIPSPRSKQILEAALNSKDPRIREVAAVNLIYNQNGSIMASQLVAKALQGETKDSISLDLALSIAASTNDPVIQSAGVTFGREQDARLWHTYSVERKQWPIYNWIDNYVVKINTE